MPERLSRPKSDRRKMTKTCRTCQESLPLESFPRDKKWKSGFDTECFGCRRVRHLSASRRWHSSNPAYRRAYYGASQKQLYAVQRNSQLVRSYGITLDEYNEMLDSQGGVCAICKRPQGAKSASRNGQPRALEVDHDHETGKVRGLLCATCNRLLAMLENTPISISAVEGYLSQ